MKYLLILAAFLALTGCGSTSSNGTNAQSLASSDDDGVVCKMEKRIGSNMMTRVCRTAEERAAMEEAGREGMLRLQRGSMTTGADGE